MFVKPPALEAFVQLPYDLVIPDVLFAEELVKFSDAERKLLEEKLRVLSLPGKRINRVQSVYQDYPALALNDCFAFVLAEENPDCILMTGDRKLRNLATHSGLEVHGILWGIDEMYKAEVATTNQLYSALLLFKQDSTVRLPRNELNRWIERYKALLNS